MTTSAQTVISPLVFSSMVNSLDKRRVAVASLGDFVRGNDDTRYIQRGDRFVPVTRMGIHNK